MKRLIYLSSFLLLAGITISSCKKSSSNNSIVGSWEVTSLHEVEVDSTTTPITVTKIDTTTVHGHTIVISFFADNSLEQYDYSTSPATIESVGSYLVRGDSLTLFSGSTPSSTGQTVKFSVSGNALSIFLNDSSPGSSVTATENFNRL
ncbi:MAG TPA: hypothetical protein VK559_07315 [Ferruginibacter sp.]|nr:hypothetical protein [Ferruginibacter sp.]